jgi:hypothetical protein
MMKRVLASESLADIGPLKNLLEQAGIDCLVRNEQLSGGLGEIPFLECLPELWVLDDARLPEAQLLLAQESAEAAVTAPWRCPRCAEQNEGQFAICWYCGTADRQR